MKTKLPNRPKDTASPSTPVAAPADCGVVAGARDTGETPVPHFLDAAAAPQIPCETTLVELIREWLGDATPPAPRGIGDDCAVLPARRFPGKRIATTDCVIRGRHFDDNVSPRDAGRKLVNRNLSDIAAMGGAPSDALLALVCGADTALPWLEAFFRGVAEACVRAGVELSGGDCAQGPGGFFCATLALTGYAPRPLLRTGARAGDTLVVTGRLGGSLASGWHYRFTPRLAEGRWLAARAGVRAAMDISDGLAKDLPALLPVDCDALLFPEQIPLSAAASAASSAALVRPNSGVRPGESFALSESAERNMGEPPMPRFVSAALALDSSDGGVSPALVHALCDGEDYELLLAVDTSALPRLLSAWRRKFPETPLTPIGRIVPAAAPPVGAFSGTAPSAFAPQPTRRLFLSVGSSQPPVLFRPCGYEHFSPSSVSARCGDSTDCRGEIECRDASRYAL